MNALHLCRWGLALTACAMLTGCPSLVSQSTPPSVDRAEALARAGDHAQAARIYEQLATETSGPDQASFLLNAAREWFAANQPDNAERVLATLPTTLTPQQADERRVLAIEGLLARGKGEEAWRQIEAMSAPAAAPAAERYFTVRQRVAFATGRHVEGVRAHIARERFLSGADRTASRNQLLGTLRGLAERGTRIEIPSGADPTLRGWLEAGPIAAENARNASIGAARIAGFRARYANHPALEALAGEPSSGGLTGEPLAPAPHVALLLPVSGRTANAAAQIRDGFLAAYYASAANNRPRIRVYDTAAGVSVADIIALAQNAGAEFIVGPLTREEVVAAADLAGTRAPILSLNFLPSDRPAPERFYQFALSPEEDARAVARYLVENGRRRGVVLTPGGDWGDRVGAAFAEELRAAGGLVIGQADFNAGANDFGASIMQVMRIADSRARHKRIEGIVGQKLEFDPRRRPDIQFIFAPSQAATARLLRPQLKFHLAGDIPTYTLADAYEPGPANAESDGLVFPDMPWMLGTGSLTSQVRGSLQTAFGEGGPRRGRLFAFGYDAYRIYASLQQSATLDMPGLTGRLTLDTERRVKRQLEWAQMRGSGARLLTSSE